MCRFIETIRVERGQACNLQLHQARVDATMARFFPGSPGVSLAGILSLDPGWDGVKCRVVYGRGGAESVTYAPYAMRPVATLRLVEADIDYGYKFEDRRQIDRAFAMRGDCDDVLIVRRGMVADTSIANVAFGDGREWFTPRHPLLPGTRRAALLRDGVVGELDIRVVDIPRFSNIMLFNAMIPWGACCLPSGCIR